MKYVITFENGPTSHNCDFDTGYDNPFTGQDITIPGWEYQDGTQPDGQNGFIDFILALITQTP